MPYFLVKFLACEGGNELNDPKDWNEQCRYSPLIAGADRFEDVVATVDGVQPFYFHYPPKIQAPTAMMTPVGARLEKATIVAF